MHLHKLPAKASCISISVGFSLWFNKLVIAITKPGVQKPHWLPPNFVNDFCIGEGNFLDPNPSTVYTEDPATCPNFNKHEFAGLSFPPLTGDKSILQAPQSPSAHPSFVPWSCFSSLIQSNKEEFGSDFDISISLSFNII